jgi:hypothetical protein
MLNFHKRFTHNQIRAALVLVGLFFVVVGSVMIYAYLDGIWGMMVLVIGIIVAGVGALIITLELTGLRRVLAIGAGFVVLAAGLVLMVPGVPGPGIPLAIVGLAILASEFKWAENLYNRLVEFSRRAADKVRGKKSTPKNEEKPPDVPTQ